MNQKSIAQASLGALNAFLIGVSVYRISEPTYLIPSRLKRFQAKPGQLNTAIQLATIAQAGWRMYKLTRLVPA